MKLNKYYYEYDREQVDLKEQFIKDFQYLLYKQKKINNSLEIVFLCIGTDRMTGDCFGPLVGNKLKDNFSKYNTFNINVYGDLKKPITYINVEQVINKITTIHKNACIVVIDAALSKKENIGKIFVENKPTILGNGLGKNKISIGDISIKAVVGKDYKIAIQNFTVLQNISLNVVFELSDIVSSGIYEVIQYN